MTGLEFLVMTKILDIVDLTSSEELISLANWWKSRYPSSDLECNPEFSRCRVHIAVIKNILTKLGSGGEPNATRRRVCCKGNLPKENRSCKNKYNVKERILMLRLRQFNIS